MIHFGIIGAGDIARKFAEAVRQLDNAEVIAVASKSLDRAQEWAAREHIPSYYGNYAELLASPRIDAVYIATTTNAHYDNILQCLQAGKHVLCEKSLVRSAHEALTVCSLAKQKNLFLMEAMWTRFLPKTTIGWNAEPVYNKRLFDPALGGGSLYDLGIYPLEVLPYLVDEKILDTDAFVARHSTGVDDLVSMNLQLESCIANLQCSFTTKMPEDAYIYGEDGYIRLPKMHFGSRAELYNSADECIDSFDSGEENGFVYEVAEVVRCIENGLLESPICPHQMTIDAARITSEVLHLNP